MEDARAGVHGVAQYFVATGDGRSGEVLVDYVVGQRALGEQLAGDAKRRSGGLAVDVLLEEMRVDDRLVLRQPAAEVNRARRGGRFW